MKSRKMGYKNIYLVCMGDNKLMIEFQTFIFSFLSSLLFISRQGFPFPFFLLLPFSTCLYMYSFKREVLRAKEDIVFLTFHT